MKKALLIIGGIVLGIIVLAFVIIFIVAASSKKLVCTSSEGNITILYNDKTITGYTASNIDYDLDGQKEIADKIGVESYLAEFSAWFSSNTTGSCTR